MSVFDVLLSASAPYEGEGSLTTLGTVVTQVLTWFTNTLNMISTTPILLVGMGMYVVGGGIGLARRALRGR